MKEAINLFAVALGWGLSSLFVAIFLSTGLTPGYCAIIRSNLYNEFWFEAILFPAVWLLITVNMVMLVWRYRRR